jgi:hypothetical protein
MGSFGDELSDVIPAYSVSEKQAAAALACLAAHDAEDVAPQLGLAPSPPPLRPYRA